MVINTTNNFGNIEIDVKCKTFYKPEKTPEEIFFYFECDDLTKHLNMQSFTKTPILIAIYERSQENKNQIKEDTIHFISINEMKILKEKFQKSRYSQYKIPTKYLHQGFNYIKEVFERI